MAEEMTREQAIALAGSHFWETMTPSEIVRFQLFEELLCMPFDVFHKAIEEALGRPVFTHEFAFDGLKKEFLGEKAPPTFAEIMDLIPADKRIVLVTP